MPPVGATAAVARVEEQGGRGALAGEGLGDRDVGDVAADLPRPVAVGVVPAAREDFELVGGVDDDLVDVGLELDVCAFAWSSTNLFCVPSRMLL